MNSDTQLKRASAQRAIRRAARVAQTAIGIHVHVDGGESAKVTGCGTCAEACRYVGTLAWGDQACRKSRETPATQALRRGRPVPFLCHMGFACVAAPVYPGSDETLVMTFGPFCPAEAPDSLEQDAATGLARLEQKRHDRLPFVLTDIPRVPADVPAEVAQWLSETLQEQWTVARSAAASADGPQPEMESTRSRRRGPDKAVRDAFGARAILAAMAAARSAPLRAAVMVQLKVPGPRRADALRARALAVAGAALEAAEREGMVPDLARHRLVDLPRTLRDVERPDAICHAVLRALSPIRRNLLRRSSRNSNEFAALDAFVTERISEPISLSAAAAHLNMTPSTLTRRIDRGYGVTFTGYVARKRVERAAELLRRTRLSVDAIARRVGFTDGAHLRKQLKRFEGVSPSDLRDPKKAVG